MVSNQFSVRINYFKEQGQCLFELRWGDRNCITKYLNFPKTLQNTYDGWRRAYLDYYQHFPRSQSSPEPVENHIRTQATRAIVKQKKQIKEPVEPKDRRIALVQAEAKLTNEFHYWLASPELEAICTEIRNAAIATSQQDGLLEPIDIFITCSPLAIARFPWETWNFGLGEPLVEAVRIARTSDNIRTSDDIKEGQALPPTRSKIRVLAITGDESGLDFSGDKAALKSLEPTVKVEFEGWRGETDSISNVKKRICEAIADDEGWDMLFFAGHSNEQSLVGGELGIAPRHAIALNEITPYLKTAKKRGLRLAIFNSCSGLNIADSLMAIGVHHVVVMREPIHNAVAHAFLSHLGHALAKHQDLQEALQETRKALQLDLDFPSASLIPSVFTPPQNPWFRIPERGWKYEVRRRIPTWQEAFCLGAILTLGLLPPVQDLLLDIRVGAQALYRQVTTQVPKTKSPVTLVQIDQTSLLEANVERYPIDQGYVADILNALAELDVPVVGVDYVLDNYRQSSSALDATQLAKAAKLKGAIQNAQEQDMSLVFGYGEHDDPRRGQISETLVNPDLAVSGDIFFIPWYLELPTSETDCDTSICPFSYQLALEFAQSQAEAGRLVLNGAGLEAQITDGGPSRQTWSDIEQWIQNYRLSRITEMVSPFGQLWFQPILDFSIPPTTAYNTIASRDLLNDALHDTPEFENLNRSVVVLATGGYDEAGFEEEGQDNFTAPFGIALQSRRKTFTGGEAHAYMLHHLLERHLVYPLPDVWLIVLAAWLGKEISIRTSRLKKKKWKQLQIGGLTVLVYGMAGLQIYTMAGVLLPWFLPSLVYFGLSGAEKS